MKIDVNKGFDVQVSRKRLTNEKPSPDQSFLQHPEEVPLHEIADHSDSLTAAVDKMNEMAEPLRTNVEFQLHDDLEEYYITVVDSSTNEVIKEIPPKELLDTYAEMAEFMGLLVDERI